MSEPCSRWIALSDRSALGEALSAEQQVFLRAHAADCPVCGAESALFGALSRLVDAPPQPAAAAGPRALPRGDQPPRRRAARALGWVLAAAASLVLSLALRPGEQPPGANGPLPAHGIRIVLASGGEIEVDGRPARPGAEIALGSLLFARRGAACLLVDHGIRACLAPGSSLRVAELSESRRRLELRAGKLAASLAPQRAGTSFGVVTREGSAIAVGTAFSVEVPPDGGPVITRVVHGTVLVRSARGAEQRVRARHASTMHGTAQPLGQREEAAERPLLELAERAPAARAGDVRSESQPAGAAGDESDPPPNRPPAEPQPNARVEAPGADALPSAPARRGRPADGDVAAPLPSAPARRASADASGAGAAAWPSSARARRAQGDAPDGDAAARLLSAAREQGARGDLEDALDTYRALFARHGDSGEALAARVAYGEMLLAAGGDAGGALASFEHYLARGGPLAREASFGRVRALRALGRVAEERAALDDFLRDFPDGPLADAVRARQTALGRP